MNTTISIGYYRLLLLLLFYATSCKSALQSDEAEKHWLKSRLGLMKSTWPSDHGDTSRSKFTLNAGLNLNNNEGSDIKITKQEDLKLSQWIYTTGNNSEYLYIIGGPNPSSLFVAKADAVSLEVLQKIPLPLGLYIGGLLMHRNGHVYCVHSNRLFRFWNGDLYNSTDIVVPYKTMNHRLIQTNGMLVTQDGYLLIKQWNLIPEDLSLNASSNVIFTRLLYLFTIVSTVASFFFLRKRWSWSMSAMAAPIFGFGFGRVMMLAFWMLFFFLILGPYNPITFLSSFHSLDPLAGRGEVKFIDPLTLEVVAEVVSAERFSYARMAMIALQNSEGEDEDAIILLGDENVYQYRWHPRTKEVFLVPGWTQKYRTYGDGSFPGTGPSIYQNVAYFTDNTFPVVSGPTYTIFAAPITTIGSRPVSIADYQPVRELTAEQQGLTPVWVRMFSPPPKQHPWVKISQRIVDANSTSPGFMFWSVVVSPMDDSVLVWNSAGHSVQCRRFSDLSLKWEIRNIKQADCLSIAADKGHVYMTDYSDGPTEVKDWLRAVTGRIYKTVNKFFIVANSSTGEIIANKTISQGAGMSVSVVVGGANNDVFVGTREALVRLYV